MALMLMNLCLSQSANVETISPAVYDMVEETPENEFDVIMRIYRTLRLIIEPSLAQKNGRTFNRCSMSSALRKDRSHMSAG